VEAVVDLGGVRTWYAVDGAGEPLVYLHGGFSDSDELDPVRAHYAARFQLYTPDRRAHGRTADVEGPLDFEMIAAGTLRSWRRSSAGPPTSSASATGPRRRCTSRSAARTWCVGW
jgi:pimeloyl-ACP methyl ester carboxylesterase